MSNLNVLLQQYEEYEKFTNGVLDHCERIGKEVAAWTRTELETFVVETYEAAERAVKVMSDEEEG